MQSHLSPYLKLFQKQLSTTLRPQQAGMEQKTAELGAQVLATLYVECEVVPRHQRVAFERYRALQPIVLDVLGRLNGDPKLKAEIGEVFRTATEYPELLPAFAKLSTLLPASNDEAAHALAKAMAGIEREIQEARHAAIEVIGAQPSNSSVTSGSTFSAENLLHLRDFLRGVDGQGSALTIEGITPILGGANKLTALLELQGAVRLPLQLVLRADKQGSPTQTTVVNEFEIIKAMHAAGVPVPEPFALASDIQLIGAPFLVMSRVEGNIIGDPMDVWAPSGKFALNLAGHLAKMHQIPVSQLDHALPGPRLSPRQRMSNDIAEVEQKWNALQQDSVAMALAFAYLKANLDLADSVPAIIHRDVGCHNMLVRDDELAGLLDWETAVIGSPAQDLGSLYHTIVAQVPWEEFLAAYAGSGGTVPRQAEINYFRLWRAVWSMQLTSMARAFVETGDTSDIGLAWAAQYALHRLEHTLSEVLDLVLSAR